MPEEKITREFFHHGAKLNITTTPVRLSNESVPLQRGVTILADLANTDTVWVGREELDKGETELKSGLPLTAGASITIPAQQLEQIYVVASSGVQKVYWVAS